MNSTFVTKKFVRVCGRVIKMLFSATLEKGGGEIKTLRDVLTLFCYCVISLKFKNRGLNIIKVGSTVRTRAIVRTRVVDEISLGVDVVWLRFVDVSRN